jgi:putative DNA methylase
MIERNFDISFISNLAFREKQIQQNYRPIIAVHKWFARRPGTLFRSLLLSEFCSKLLRDTYYESNNFSGLRIADPFMGGGTPLIEANRLGCDVIGFDINPMSYWIVKQEIEHLNIKQYDQAAQQLRKNIEKKIGHLYRTSCEKCDSSSAHVKYFLWVKVQSCSKCRKNIDLFPGYLLASDTRHPKNVFVCPACGNLTESEDRENPGKCIHCHTQLKLSGPAKRNLCQCPHCGSINTFPDVESGPPRHRLFAIEYYCPDCKSNHKGRFFKKPDLNDLALIEDAEARLARLRPQFIPEDLIPCGDETDRLHRWGYRSYREMFGPRQLLGLELSARAIVKISQERVRNALATNLSDLLRYQNMLCRYDTMALKSLDIFSIHGFPVGLIQCESNFLGIMEPRNSHCVGSGGWANIIEKFRKAKLYCDRPFEIRHHDRKREIVSIEHEWIGDYYNGQSTAGHRNVSIVCANAAAADIKEKSLDAVFTDPPYFGNVQYAELMDFCYVWLRRLVGEHAIAFTNPSTRSEHELTGNENMRRGLDHFTDGLSAVFKRMAKALKSGAPLTFTYHHNDIKAYYPVAVAILDAGLTCSASFPCPAEMGASIHIRGTGSSIIDTVFVCRSTGSVPRGWLPESPEGVANLVNDDLKKLIAGNVKVTLGDIKCITYGHLIRLAIWSLRISWEKHQQAEKKISTVASWLEKFGGWPAVEKYLKLNKNSSTHEFHSMVRESNLKYGADYAEVSF